MNRPGKIPVKQVADDLTSDGIVPLAGAEDCHRFGVEQGIQVMLGHGDLLVDLDRVEPNTLSRYMGTQEAHEFLYRTGTHHVDVDTSKPRAA